ncbi:MAG: phosphopyruvate hydratase, partial [Thermoplasmata archaeon]
FAQDDWEGFAKMTKEVGHDIEIVGDDLLVTNPKRIAMGIEKRAVNGLLLKVNQIGTLTETMDTVRFAKKSRYNCVVSHRSGETEDTSISDISVATNAGQIKTGAPSRGERTAKYNRLLRIEEEIGSKAKFPGLGAFKLRA